MQSCGRASALADAPRPICICEPLPGDWGSSASAFQGDWVVDADDFARFAAALDGTAPAWTTAANLQSFDADHDNDLDLADFAEFQVAFGTSMQTGLGACCLPDGICVEVWGPDCSGGAVYQGDGTTCDIVTCPPTGACCLPDGTCEELTEAGEDYPEWVTERYLQLPRELPGRVRWLADRLTEDAGTPYEKALAIQKHILGLRYNVNVEVPPAGTDGVDYFLFDAREGVCTAFASAMAVMLRTVDVPARINTGYLEGELDAGTGDYNIRVKDYHARTEVYFPEYGWVEFSATPVGRDVGDFIGTAFGEEPEQFGPDSFMFEGQSFGIGGPFDPVVSERPTWRGPALYVYFAIIGIPLAVILAVRVAIALLLARLKHANSAAEAYVRMCQLATLSRIGPLSQETPLEYCARLASLVPVHALSIDNIAQAYVETRFSPRRELVESQLGRLQKAWVELCPVLLRRIWRFGRQED